MKINIIIIIIAINIMYQFKSIEKPSNNLQTMEVPSIIKNKPLKCNENDGINSIETKIVGYECQKCLLLFSTKEISLNHVKTHNLYLANGVSPEFLIREVSHCRKCNKQVESISEHACEYVCAACFNVYKTMGLFDEHARKWHDEGLETLFIPNSIEFRKWRLDLELQTYTKYSAEDKYNGKCFYHCSIRSKGNLLNFLCPSSIIAQDFKNGILVYFYSKHFRHKSVEYLLHEKYKKWHTTTIMQFHNNDMYVQFKGLMDNIIIESAKLNGGALNVLMGKALEMALILSNYDEDNDISINPDRVKENTTIPNQNDTNVKVGKRKRKPVNEIEQNTEQESVKISSNKLIVPNTSFLYNTEDCKKYNGSKLKTYLSKSVTRSTSVTEDLTEPENDNNKSCQNSPQDVDDLHHLQNSSETDPSSLKSNILMANKSEQTKSYNNTFASFIAKNYNVNPNKKRHWENIHRHSNSNNISSASDQVNNNSNHNITFSDQNNHSPSIKENNSENTTKKYHLLIDENGTIRAPNSNNYENKNCNFVFNYGLGQIQSFYSLNVTTEDKPINDGSDQIESNNSLDIKIEYDPLNNGSDQIESNNSLDIKIEDGNEQSKDNSSVKNNKNIKTYTHGSINDGMTAPKTNRNYVKVESTIDKVGNNIKNEVNNSLKQYIRVNCKSVDVEETTLDHTKVSSHINPSVKLGNVKRNGKKYGRNRYDKHKKSKGTNKVYINSDTTRSLRPRNKIKTYQNKDKLENKSENKDDIISKRKTDEQSKLSNVETSTKVSVRNFAIEKPKVVLEYEVKEQETDCNILVLKI